MAASPPRDSVQPYPTFAEPRGCQYPGCGKETRAYTELEGLSYCDEHIGIVKSGVELRDKFTPLTGTGEP